MSSNGGMNLHDDAFNSPPPIPGPCYGALSLQDIHLVRSMSVDEFKSLTPTLEGVEFHARTNVEKAAAAPHSKALSFLAETGFDQARQASRNTLHFSANSLVTDHAYGSFSRDVIAIVPLDDNLTDSGPSSFNEVDVAFPFKEGKREFKNVTFFVREDLASELSATHLSFQTFKPGYEEDAVRDFLASNGVALQTAGMHGWKESGVNQEEGIEFADDLSQTVGHEVALGVHAGTPEEKTEGVLARWTASARSLFEGELLYQDDSGCDLSQTTRLEGILDEMKALQEEAQHPDTKAHLGSLLEVTEGVTKKAISFASTLIDYKETAEDRLGRILINEAPATCQPQLARRLGEIKAELHSQVVLPPPLPPLDGVEAGAHGALPPPLPMDPLTAPPYLPTQPPPLPLSVSNLFASKLPSLDIQENIESKQEASLRPASLRP